jgi:K319L-like, PKD domain
MSIRFKKGDEEKKKRRKALAALLSILEKIYTIKEWNERLHKLHSTFERYENVLPSDIRHRIDGVANITDIKNLENYLRSLYEANALTQDDNSGYGSHGGPARLVGKIVIIVIVILVLGITAAVMSSGEHKSDNQDDNNDHRSGAINHDPIANAGSGQVIQEENPAADEGPDVHLDGTGSSDRDGDVLSYNWRQVGGSEVRLDNQNSPAPVFQAPQLEPTDTFGNDGKPVTLSFKLTVDDSHGGRDTDVTHIKILPSQCPGGQIVRDNECQTPPVG